MIRLGTRGSALALAQARLVAERLPDAELVPITTSGDRGRGADKARFVKELEEALLGRDIDVAVHSAIDAVAAFGADDEARLMADAGIVRNRAKIAAAIRNARAAQELPEGLSIVGVPERADARDALCGAGSLASLAPGAVVGTGSLRRRAQLLALRPDLDVHGLRGNVDTRLGRLSDGAFDAIVLARAGLERLGRASEGMPLDELVPAPGQGSLLLEGRSDDERVAAAAAALTDRSALVRLTAERALVGVLDASCHTPIGAHAELADGTLCLTAFVGLPDGSHWIRDSHEGDPAEPAALGRAVADRLLAVGAAELLAAAEGAAGVPLAPDRACG